MTKLSFGIIGGAEMGMWRAENWAGRGHRVVLIINGNEKCDHEMMTIVRGRKNMNITRDLSDAASLDYILYFVKSAASFQTDDWRALQSLALYLRDDASLILCGSVPIGAGDALQVWFKQRKKKVTVISSPDFLESNTRFVLGCDSKHSKLITLRRHLANDKVPILVTTRKNAEILACATLAFSATTASFMNQLALFCEQVGADVQTIARGMGMEPSIGQALVKAGVGVGGSTALNGLDALIEQGKNRQCDISLFQTVKEAMLRQSDWVFEKLSGALGSLEGKRIAIWGEFEQREEIKAGCCVTTSVLEEGRRLGATMSLYNPKKMSARDTNWLERDKDEQVIWSVNPMMTVQRADALIILTDLQTLKEINLFELKRRLGRPIIIDGRNVYPTKMMEEIGFNYICFGRKI